MFNVNVFYCSKYLVIFTYVFQSDRCVLLLLMKFRSVLYKLSSIHKSSMINLQTLERLHDKIVVSLNTYDLTTINILTSNSFSIFLWKYCQKSRDRLLLRAIRSRKFSQTKFTRRTREQRLMQRAEIFYGAKIRRLFPFA